MEDCRVGEEVLDLAAIFGNDRPVEVDLGCGKGLFLVQEAAARPSINFIGVDRMNRKVERAYRRAGERWLENVRLFRCDVFDFVHRLLPLKSIAVFHVYFPDPWPKRRHHRRRFFTITLIKALAAALTPEGKVWMATDHGSYFDEVVNRFEGSGLFQRLAEDKPPNIGVTDFEVEFRENGVPIFRAGFEKREAVG